MACFIYSKARRKLKDDTPDESVTCIIRMVRFVQTDSTLRYFPPLLEEPPAPVPLVRDGTQDTCRHWVDVCPDFQVKEVEWIII